MADILPSRDNTSNITTSPPKEIGKATAIYRKHPSSYSQVGLATPYTSLGEGYQITTKPNYYKLSAWDLARKKEPIIDQGLNTIKLSLLGRMGEYSHPDPMIEDFVNANLQNKVKKWVADLLVSTLWSGFAVSEINWTNKIGPSGMPQVWLDDLTNFHPLHINFVLDDFGKLNHGAKVTHSLYKSGIWVPFPQTQIGKKIRGVDKIGSLVRLHASKKCFISYNTEGNNIYGQSILESVLDYHLFKEAFRDLMYVALDRYGTPLIYAIVPPMDTNESVQDPDGTVRPLTLQEQVVQSMENISAESGIVLTQISKDQPVQLGALTTGNNFGDSFQQAIDFCDKNMIRGLKIPDLVLNNESSNLGTGKASEVQTETFNTFIDSLHDIIVNQGFVEQVVKQLILYNFDTKKHPTAHQAGEIKLKPNRTAELKVWTDLIQVLNEGGYISSLNESDYNHTRQLAGFPVTEHNPNQIIKDIERKAKAMKPPVPATSRPSPK